MAFDPAPSTWLGSGYTLSSHVAGFNTNDAVSNKLLVQLTDAKANATTGDIRTVMMGVSEAFYQAWSAILVANRPTKMTVSRSASSTSTSTKFTYTFGFTVDTNTFGVSSE